MSTRCCAFTASASSLEDYLHGLGVEVSLGPVREDEVPRVPAPDQHLPDPQDAGATGPAPGADGHTFAHHLADLPAVPDHVTLHDAAAPGGTGGLASVRAEGEQDVVDDRGQVRIGDG
jgi:hypothetical protein